MKQLDNANSQDNAEILSAQKGSQQALEKLVLLYKGMVLRVARNYYMVGGGDRDDIIQEGTIGLLKAIMSYNLEGKASFSTHAYTCISNNIKDAIKKSNSMNSLMLSEAIQGTSANGEYVGAEQAESPSLDVVEAYEASQKRAEFYDILSSLITAEQMAIVKLYMDGYSYKDIAEKTGKSTKNIDNTLSAIKAKIKKAGAKFASLQGE